ncbi:MAG TPA: DoxX family protein [Verrucomicrobiae bacterium]
MNRTSLFAVNAGHLGLRLATGGMIFYRHGWHKLTGGIAWWRHGTPWPLLADVQSMHLPAAAWQAWAATIVQLICPVGLMLGWFTRVHAALLTGVLAGAVLQNWLTQRDAQLAELYLLLAAVLIGLGGGPWSLDTRKQTLGES